MALLVGFALVVGGLYLGSSRFLEFAASHLSPDGVLDEYTIDQVQAFSLKVMLSGFLVPAIALIGPALTALRPSGRQATLAAGIALVIIAVLYLWLSYFPPCLAANMKALPDEAMYTIPAVNIVEKGRFVMMINGREFPPLPPFGFPLLLVPFYFLFGPMIGNGIRAVQAGVLLSLILMCLLSSIVAGRKRGLIAVLLLSANPLLVLYSSRMMGVTVQLALTIATLICLASFARKATRGAVALLGFLSGFLCLISYSSLLLLPILLMAVLYVLVRKKMRVGGPTLLFILSSFAVILIFLSYNRAVFGSFFVTGYHYWAWSPSSSAEPLDLPFSLVRFNYDVVLLQALSKVGLDTQVGGLVATLLDISGLGEIYNLALFILFVVGLLSIRNPSLEYRALLLFLFLFLAESLVSNAFLAVHVSRYLLPAIPVILLVSADGFCLRFARGCMMTRLTLSVLLAFALSGIADLFNERFLGEPYIPRRYEIAQSYRRIVGEGDLVISGECLPYVAYFLEGKEGVTLLPVSRKVRLSKHRGRPLFPVASESLGLLRDHLSRGARVYIDDLREKDYPDDFKKIREAFQFERVRSVGTYSIFRLSPAAR